MVEPILARMNCGALIPVPAIYFDVVGHVKSMRLIRKPRKKRPALPSSFSKRPLPLLALFGTAAVVAACPLLNDEQTRANRRAPCIRHRTHTRAGSGPDLAREAEGPETEIASVLSR